MPQLQRSLVLTCIAATAMTACTMDSVTGLGRGTLEVRVAPLSLPGVGMACYDVRVDDGTETVWQRGNPDLTRLGASQRAGGSAGPPDTGALCSTAYGSGAGADISYVGSCDAGADADPATPGVQNGVTVWIDGLYNAAGTADLGDWRDPCPGGCTLYADCDANADSAVTFDLSVMRSARQGFFDIAITFDDIYCSAKFDTCNDDGDDDDALADPIRLVFGADDQRDWSGVFGFACSAGSDAVETELLYGQILVTCGSDVFVLDPAGPPGSAAAVVADNTLHYSVFRGAEQLSCGAGSCHKLYWNLALSVDDLASFGGTCTLAFEATASDGGEGFTAGLPTSTFGSHPYIAVDATLTAGGVAVCQQNALDAVGSAVVSVYRGALGGLETPLQMCSTYDGTTTSATTTGDCAPPVPAATSFSIGTNTPHFNLMTAAGNPTTPREYVVTVEPGVVVSSNFTSLAAFSTGNLPAGSSVTLINHGYILGMGGAGSAGTQCTNTVAGGAGGAAVDIRVPLTIDNADGNIWGGGGGGSGSAGNCAGNYGGSGGGGAGGGLGAAGHPSYPSQPGTTGPTGSGGAGSYGSWGGGLGYNTSGGNGGGYGSDGARGSNYSGSWGNQPGGVAGQAVKLNGQAVTWTAGNTASRVKGPVQ